MLDIDFPDNIQGTSFTDKNQIDPRRYVFATSDRVDEGFELSRAVNSVKYMYIRNYMPHLPLLQPNFYTDQSEIMQELKRASRLNNICSQQKALFEKTRMPEELYDLENDPNEINKLATDKNYSQVLVKMREAHIKWVLKTDDC